MIESALGVYRCFDMLKASPRVATACIGSAQDGDLQTDLGCAWSSDGPELMYAKSKVLLDTRAAGKLYPLDGVFSDLNDIEGARSRFADFGPPGLRRPHGHPPEADRAGAAGLFGARRAGRVLHACGERVRGGGEDRRRRDHGRRQARRLRDVQPREERARRSRSWTVDGGFRFHARAGESARARSRSAR